MTAAQATAHYAPVRLEKTLTEQEYSILKRLHGLISEYTRNQLKGMDMHASQSLTEASYNLENMGFRFEYVDTQPVKEMLLEGDSIVLLTQRYLFVHSPDSAQFADDYQFMHSKEVEGLINDLLHELYQEHGGPRQWRLPS